MLAADTTMIGPATTSGSAGWRKPALKADLQGQSFAPSMLQPAWPEALRPQKVSAQVTVWHVGWNRQRDTFGTS
jgi:hypothetical protein